MVLGCDENTPGGKIAHRMIPSSMPEGKLRRRSAERETEKLVSETDPEYRSTTSGQLANCIRRVIDRVRVSRPVREKDSVGLLLERGRSRCVGGHNCHPAVMVCEQAQDIALDTEIVGDDVAARARSSPRVRYARADFRGQI